jgi:Electron transfer DM13
MVNRTTARKGRVRALLRKPLTWGVVVFGVIVVGIALALFQPWKLWIDQTVNEVPPASAGDKTAESAAGKQPGRPVELAHGTLISHEHTTSGTVHILRLADGTRLLRLEDLDTSNGPLLKVWLTDAPVLPDRGGWHVFDDGKYLDLGGLKGNKGSQNYLIPPATDLAQYRSVSIWCDRFNVSFGAAALVPN